jgi:hypothetical protein
LGAPPQNSLGVTTPNQFGQIVDFTSILKKDEDDF